MELDHIDYMLKSSEVQKFVDVNFPPTFKSIFGADGGCKPGEPDPLRNVKLTWLRAGEIFGEDNFKVFDQTIEPNDIKQGLLGNCWLMCALSCLAEFPQYIKNLFIT